MQTFGEYLRDARNAVGLRQQEVADRLKPSVKRQVIWHWENNKYLPKEELFDQLAAILKIEPDNLLTRYNSARVEKVQNRLTVNIPKGFKYTRTASGNERAIPVISSKKRVDLENLSTDEYFTPSALQSADGICYKITDDSMEPKFTKKDFIIADKNAPVLDNSLVIIQIKERTPLFRIYSKKNNTILLRATNPKTSAILIKESDVEWRVRATRQVSSL